ncbi:response regulator transcription factor [Luteimonas aestuarii]|uniref:Response regulator transcription factor n=1 Tax=Luteimonas aestuarii TaxID=453837 RepID=A0A4R5U505_9GAMM|nr:response regulator transcription factor [Luteimonas aestuarii]
MQVAVTEDDVVLREQLLLPGLTGYGFGVEGFGSTTALYRRMLERRFDIIVMDMHLPGEDGLAAVAHLRNIMPGLGIVMLTAESRRERQLRAMRDGVDVFLPKPTDMDVLAATLHSLGRRLQMGALSGVWRQPDVSPGKAAPTQPRPGWRLSSDGWCLLSPDGSVIALTVPERQLLRVLDATRGRPVPRDVLIAELSTGDVEYDPHRLETLVSRIRRKAVTVPAGNPPLPLLAVRGVGYVLAE